MANNDGFPEEHLPKVIHLFVSKKAEDWFWLFKRDKPNASWNTIKSAMLSYFSSFDYEDEIQEQILRRHQGNRETFSDFALSVQKLNARLQHRISESRLIYRLCKNMIPALQNLTLPYQQTIRTIEELRVLCQRFEHMWDQTQYDPRRFTEAAIPRRRIINELTQEFERMDLNPRNNDRSMVNRQISQERCQEETETINELKKTPFHSNSIQLICWNCKDLGHRYQDCPQDLLNVFCFGCGAANVRKPNCPSCQLKQATENYRPGVTMMRGSRYGVNVAAQQPKSRDPNSNPSTY